MHDARAIRPASRVRRLTVGLVASVLVAGSVVLFASDEGSYNSNPTYCHSHGPYDLLYYYYRCWLPDPPSDPY